MNKSRYQFLGMLFAASLLFISSCKNSEASSSQSKEVIITQQRLACLGTCPVYVAKIYSDGSVMFTGEQYVPKTGETEFKITKKELESIVADFESLNFFSLEDSYTANISDGMTTYISYKKGETEKRIMDYHGAPEGLRELEEKIQSTLFGYLK